MLVDGVDFDKPVEGTTLSDGLFELAPQLAEAVGALITAFLNRRKPPRPFIASNRRSESALSGTSAAKRSMSRCASDGYTVSTPIQSSSSSSSESKSSMKLARSSSVFTFMDQLSLWSFIAVAIMSRSNSVGTPLCSSALRSILPDCQRRSNVWF